MEQYNILIVEDDKEIRDGIEIFLKSQNYNVFKAADGVEGLEVMEREKISLAIVDIMMPRMDGFSLLAQMRESGNETPVIFLTAKDSVPDRVRGLDAGADDYLTKPFSVEELLARLRVTQRRLLLLQASGDADTPIFENGELKIDYAAGCAYLKGEELHLTPIEYKLLCLLSHNVGKVLTHTYITQQIWGSSWENDIASLRVFMATLRKKLELQKDSPQYIQTHIGVGYRMLRVD